MLITTIENKTYDITEFLESHPGGKMMLETAIGRDSTYLFWSYHINQEKARKFLSSLPVIETKEKEYESPDFLFRLQDRVSKYFQDNQLSKRGGMFNRFFLWLSVYILITYLTFLKGYWQLSPLAGLLYGIAGMCLHHDANHGTFSKNNKINKLLSYSLDVLGWSSVIWRTQHNFGHHSNPNDYELDPDANAGEPYLRYHRVTDKMWCHKYQHLYWPFLLSTTTIAGIITDCIFFRQRRYKNIKLSHLNTYDIFLFYFFKVFHITLLFVIPTILYGQWYSFFITHTVLGLYSGVLFAINHTTDDIAINSEKKTENDWAKKQIAESSNWRADSKIINYLTGGLNQQIEHHLFPGISNYHYPNIRHIVEEECHLESVPYTSYDSFSSNFSSFMNLLKRYGA